VDRRVPSLPTIADARFIDLDQQIKRDPVLLKCYSFWVADGHF
jgi:hypothetical protein